MNGAGARLPNTTWLQGEAKNVLVSKLLSHEFLRFKKHKLTRSKLLAACSSCYCRFKERGLVRTPGIFKHTYDTI